MWQISIDKKMFNIYIFQSGNSSGFTNSEIKSPQRSSWTSSGKSDYVSVQGAPPTPTQTSEAESEEWTVAKVHTPARSKTLSFYLLIFILS